MRQHFPFTSFDREVKNIPNPCSWGIEKIILPLSLRGSRSKSPIVFYSLWKNRPNDPRDGEFLPWTIIFSFTSYFCGWKKSFLFTLSPLQYRFLKYCKTVQTTFLNFKVKNTGKQIALYSTTFHTLHWQINLLSSAHYVSTRHG